MYFHELYTSEYVGFLTNRDMRRDTGRRLIELYDARWNIENGFKEAKDYRIRTCSKNPAYQLLLVVIGHLMVNLQEIVRNTRFRVRYYEMEEIIRLLLDPMVKGKDHPISHRLTVRL